MTGSIGDVFDEREFDNVEEAIAFLSSGSWTNTRLSSPYQLAYRGQADSSWPLIPSAFRAGTRLGFVPGRKTHVSTGDYTSIEQKDGEIIAVKQFIEYCDRVGLPIPSSPLYLKQHNLDLWSSNITGNIIGTNEWPGEESLEILALAQHHGIPTRLLDFTFSPLVALSFAVNGERILDQLTHFSIWGINLDAISSKPLDYGVIESPRFSNPFLEKQKGIFIFNRRLSCESSERPNRGNLQQNIIDDFSEPRERYSRFYPILFKANIPVDLTEKSKDILHMHMIDKPHLMPTYDNVASHLKSMSKGIE